MRRAAPRHGRGGRGAGRVAKGGPPSGGGWEGPPPPLGRGLRRAAPPPPSRTRGGWAGCAGGPPLRAGLRRAAPPRLRAGCVWGAWAGCEERPLGRGCEGRPPPVTGGGREEGLRGLRRATPPPGARVAGGAWAGCEGRTPPLGRGGGGSGVAWKSKRIYFPPDIRRRRSPWSRPTATTRGARRASSCVGVRQFVSVCLCVCPQTSQWGGGSGARAKGRAVAACNTDAIVRPSGRAAPGDHCRSRGAPARPRSRPRGRSRGIAATLCRASRRRILRGMRWQPCEEQRRDGEGGTPCKKRKQRDA